MNLFFPYKNPVELHLFGLSFIIQSVGVIEGSFDFDFFNLSHSSCTMGVFG